jgi:hypothetical protein
MIRAPISCFQSPCTASAAARDPGSVGLLTDKTTVFRIGIMIDQNIRPDGFDKLADLAVISVVVSRLNIKYER